MFIHELRCFEKTSKWAQRSSEFFFFFASQRVNKNRSSTLHGMMFLFRICRDVFLLTNTLQRLEANDRENTSFVQSEKQTIVLHTVNLSMYGDKAALEIIRI